MAIVTGIVASPRKDGRFDLLVNGRDVGRVSLDVVERFALRIGRILDELTRSELEDAIAVLAVYDRALNMLAVQARSRRDLRRRLIQKGEVDARVDVALDRLAAAGLLNDEVFARQFTRSRVLGRGASKRRVRDELFRRGVAGSAADEAIADVFDEEQVDESSLVESAARKKLRTLGSVDEETRRRRLYSFLARRGYDATLIRATVARLVSEAGLEGESGLSSECEMDADEV